MIVFDLTGFIMYTQQRKNLYFKIDRMIRESLSDDVTKATEKLNISKNSFYQCLDEMRMLGAPIIYNQVGGRYVYPVNSNFRFEHILYKEMNVIIDNFIANHKLV